VRLPFLSDEEEEDLGPDRSAGEATEIEEASRRAPLHWAWTVVIAAGAALPRLLYLFVFSDPENAGPYGDVYHHWQIAYLTKEIGLSAPGGPRLWDLKGLDYIWGVLHPLLMVAIFDLTGSVDIVLDRLVSLVCGVVSTVLLFHLSRRFWNTPVAIAVAAFAATLPTSVMNDASGMVEPLGVMLSLLGILAWARRADGRAGLLWGLSSMARAESWLFGLGLVVAALLRRRSLLLVAGFVGVVGLYMKLLLDKTGNPIYPLWWNFFATALGRWQPAVIAPDLAAVRVELIPLCAISVAGLAWTLWRRPAGYLLLVFGFGYCVFATGMFGLTAFLSTWVWWLPLSRRFEFPVLFLALLGVVAVFAWAPSRMPWWHRSIGWATIAVALVAAQLLWVPIGEVFGGRSEAAWRVTVAESEQLGAWYHQPAFEGHALAVPPDRPDMTYALARYANVEGKHLVSEMYGPFAYLPDGYTYADHADTVNTLLACWFHQTDTRLFAVPRGDPQYDLMLQLNPLWFTHLGTLENAGWVIEGVSAPAPSAAECRAAQAAAR
jgi:Dolichyl-phosphate-mannose-protein mannosyltransferase